MSRNRFQHSVPLVVKTIAKKSILIIWHQHYLKAFLLGTIRTINISFNISNNLLENVCKLSHFLNIYIVK